MPVLPSAPPEAAAPAGAPAPQPEQCQFTFTGSGKEYFRIWIVNLLLTVATLGLYSAWAKVRRLQYFHRNTSLAGATLDFHGDPKAILKGRLLGVLLLTLYHYGFGFSLAFGATVAALLLLAFPFLMRSALRFRLVNTSYRGLSFGFSGTIAGAYQAYLPPMLTVLLPGALFALDPSGRATLASLLLYLGWPLMHGAMKRYQHAHLLYGGEHSHYAVPARRFYGPYLRGVLLGLASLVGVIVVFASVGVGLFVAGSGRNGALAVGAFGILISTYIVFLLAIPFLQARFGNLAWNNTSFPGMQVQSRLSARRLARLHAANVVLTLLTLGLYRPFAVVRVYRYRLACATLLAEGSFEQAAGSAARRNGAGGDAVADLFGFDLSW